jgi:hypothetical protein
MNDSATQRIRELLWRRHLTETEAAELQGLLVAHPEARAEYEAEQALSEVLEHLPEAPAVSSNFTALVVRAVEREAQIRTRPEVRWWSLHRWLPRIAVASVVLGLSVAAWHHHDAEMKARVTMAHVKMARDVEQLGAALVVSAPELTENFDSMRRLSDSTPGKADKELLTLMQ